jgi:hypothetical protein
MTTRMIICCTSLDCSELGKSSFEGGGAQRTNEGHGVALWLRPGIRGDDGPLEVILAEGIAGEKLVDVGSVFEMTEHYRQPGRIGTCRWSMSKCCTGTGGVGLLRCSTAFANATGASPGISLVLEGTLPTMPREKVQAAAKYFLYRRHGFEIMDTIQVGSSPSIFPMLCQPR